VVLQPRIGELITSVAVTMDGAEVVLLNFGSTEPSEFTRQGAVNLIGGTLAGPVDMNQLHSTAAYLITATAASRLAKIIVPVRVPSDRWKHLHDDGGFDSLRCVVPPPIRVSADFRSTLDYTAADTWKSTALDLVARYRIPPFHQVMSVYRGRRAKHWSQSCFVD
jgi:hypothetical protein